jgi:hypothetical protein
MERFFAVFLLLPSLSLPMVFKAWCLPMSEGLDFSRSFFDSEKLNRREDATLRLQKKYPESGCQKTKFLQDANPGGSRPYIITADSQFEL